MVQYSVQEVRRLGVAAGSYRSGGAREVLRHSATAAGPFDVFLSHSFQDAELILGVRAVLQQAGKSVYVDWIDDPQLNRSLVSKTTANRLRERMDQCSSLIYAATRAATISKWMPWELGYFDGRKSAEAVAVMPLVMYAGENVGQEYLDLYPTIERSATYATPVVTRRAFSRTAQKSLDDLVRGRGGSAWRTV